MDLKLRRVTHDIVTKETIVEFCHVLDPYPVVTVSTHLMSQPDQTEIEIEARIKRHAKDILEAAIQRCH